MGISSAEAGKDLSDVHIPHFWDRVVIRSPDDCWEWQATVDNRGYGVITVKGRIVKAHRYSRSRVESVKAKLVMHLCDNPRCVNPAHLRTGSNADNTRDCMQKGRHRAPRTAGGPAGELNQNAKLTQLQVDAIRRRILLGETVRDLADEFKVCYQTVYLIVKGKTWTNAA